MKFNPENKETLTVGECLSPAMEIKDPETAKQYLKDYIAYMKDNIGWTQEENNVWLGDLKISNYALDDLSFESIAKCNIGFYAGYYDNETRERVEKLFDCGHPVFGKIAELGLPSQEESYECGYQQKTLAEIRKQKTS